MKFRNILKILILIIAVFVFTGCEEKERKFSLTQDGNFLVYNTKEELTKETAFPVGTQLIVKVREDMIEEGYMIDKVIINSIVYEPTFQYHITVDRNIDLKVTFIEIPSGEVRISIVGYPLEIEPHSPDNVYPKNTLITLKAPQYYKFDYLYINDEKVIINDFTYELLVEKPIKIVVDRDSLVKTHVKVEIITPNDRPVSIDNPSEDDYYLIGQELILRAPQNYHFAGKISINGRYINITGDMINIKVEPGMTIDFFTSNIVLNAFNITLLDDNLKIVGDPNQTLYAHGSSVMIKTINDNGLDIIDKLIVNGREISVNNVIYEYTGIDDNLEISATYKKYRGPYQEIQITTTEFYPILSDDLVYSPGLNISMFLKQYQGEPTLVFQKAASIKTRIDNGLDFKYVEFIVKYDVEDVSIYRNGFGFINRNEVIYAGSVNHFSIELEFTALVPNLENLDEYETNSFIETSDHVGNLTYTLELNGLDVTSEYINAKSGLVFSPEAVGKEFDLIIQSDEGITIIQPIKVVVGKNVYNKNDLTFDVDMIMQSNLVLDAPITVNRPSRIIGNYHSIIFDTSAPDLITVNNTVLNLESVMLKSRQENMSMIKGENATINLNNIVLKNTKFGLYLINSDLRSKTSKFQNILESNILLVNDYNVAENIQLSVYLESNVFQKTNGSSILIVDLYQKPQPEGEGPTPVKQVPRHYWITLKNNAFNNVRSYEDLTPELELTLQQLELTDPKSVDRNLKKYNLTIILDGGAIYEHYFPLLEITHNDDPQCVIFVMK